MPPPPPAQLPSRPLPGVDWAKTCRCLLIPAEGVRAGAALTELGFTASNGEAKRKIAEGAVKLDGEAVDDPAMLIPPPADGDELRLSLGKKRHAILRAS